MKAFAADLHIHTALSPCADDGMTPPEIAVAAIEAGLDLIAVCDHNSAGNAAAVQQVARGPGHGMLTVIAGIEIATREEVHLLALFSDAPVAEEVARAIRGTLPEVRGAKRRVGRQWLLEYDGARLGEEPRMLSLASSFSLEEAVALVHLAGGLAIAAHVDRPAFSVMSQLGFLPGNVPFDALEISAAGVDAGKQQAFAAHGFPLLTSSDAHYIHDIGKARTRMHMNAPTFEEVAKCLRGDGGRRCTFA
ncbi:MAG: PHP domain-containing protein [Candidatus Hydrogenedentota bacterium]